MTHLRKMMLEELERRNYAQTTIDCYLRAVAEFSLHFRRPPNKLGPEHIRQYQALLFGRQKLAPSTVTRWYKTRKPNPKIQAGSMRECTPPLCLGAHMQIARGLVINPEKLGKVDKY